MTPEELRWRASAYDPDKAQRNQKLQFILLRFWSAFAIVWIVAIDLGADLFSWRVIIVLLGGYFSNIVGIINNRRIQRGQRPWGDI